MFCVDNWIRLVTLLGATAELKAECADPNVPRDETPRHESMFTRRLFISLLIGFLSLLCILIRRKGAINMPPKPKLNVQNFPRPPLLERTPRHLQVKWHGLTIADTKDAYWVLETYHPPSKFSYSLCKKNFN